MSKECYLPCDRYTLRILQCNSSPSPGLPRTVPGFYTYTRNDYKIVLVIGSIVSKFIFVLPVTGGEGGDIILTLLDPRFSHFEIVQ